MNWEGIICILTCTVLGFGAFYFKRLGRYNSGILILTLLGLILRVYTSLDFYLHCWDERYHALVAKNLIHNPLKPTLYKVALLPYEYTNWTANHIWLHKQPLSLWLMSVSLKIFGVHEIAVRIPSVILSTVCIALVFYVGKYFYSERTGFMAAFFFSINGLIIEVCSGRVATDHPDTIFLFFILLSVFFTVKFLEKTNKIFNLLVGISLGAALLTKWLPGLIVLPVWALIVWGSQQYKIGQIAVQLAVILGTAILIFLPWQIYIQHHFPLEALWEREYNARHFFEILEGHDGQWYYFLNRIRIDYGELIYLPMIWALFWYNRDRKDVKLLALIIWIFVPLFFFSIAATKMNGYMLIASPALFIVTAEFYYTVVKWEADRFYDIGKRIVLALLVILPIRYCIERVKPFEQKERRPSWVQKLKNWDGKNNTKAVIFGVNSPIEAMFYTNAIVYETVPPADLIDSFQKSGYEVFINNSSAIGAEIKKIKGVSFVQFGQNQF